MYALPRVTRPVLLGLCLALGGSSFAWSAAPDNAIPRSRSCDRACLYDVLDQYLSALNHKDPWSAPWAGNVRNSEKNVMLEVGDGLWGTLTRVGGYQLRLADPDSGQVAYFGNVDENGAVSPYVVRLKVEASRITEAETLVRRKADDANYMADPQFERKAILEEILPAATRPPRARLVSLADGYWDTLQLNDGTLFTQFDKDCDRVENGVQTTNNAAMAKQSFTMTLGCEEQFRLGNFRYDDRLRQRAYPLVDVERGIVLSRAFMDHAGRVGDYKLTDGREMTSRYRRPHSYYMLELFKMNAAGKIRQIEAVFMSVPYHTKSVWEN
ncbi:MAG: hypothetical protein ABIP38_13920 [Steroidobacteraceae bacterium]